MAISPFETRGRFRRNYLSFAGRNSKEFLLYLSGPGVYNSPEVDVTATSVPGKNGDILTENARSGQRRFHNVDIKYEAFFFDGLPAKTTAVKSWLLSPVGYQKLMDTYNPDFFRMAVCREAVEFEVTSQKAAKMDLVFHCKPQRWSVEGQKPVRMEAPGVIRNPFDFPSQPIIRVYEYHVPGAIYATENTAANNSAKSSWYARNYVQTLYPESFLYEKLPLLINGQRSWNMKGTRKNQDVVDKETVSLQMGGSEELKTCNLSFQMIKTANSVLKGKPVRYLPIGDSMLGNTIPDNCGEYSIGWNHSAEAKRFAVLDAADLGIEDNFCCLGTCHTGTRAKFSYQGADFTMKACDEGRGSWTTANYLRHCSHTTTTASGSGSGFHNKIAWDSLGLGRKIPYGEVYSEEAAYEEYSYSTEQRKMIQRTPHGYYHWDYSQELWAFLKQKHPSSFIGLSVYTGDDSDRDAIDDAMEYLLTHPDNPFFDWETAKSTGSYGFSLSQYLKRYRTLDDDGVTRLIVGETAGSQITSKNVGIIDVCTPTHVTIELGENDRWWFPNDPAQTVSDVLLMMQAIHSEYPDIYVGFLTTRMMGVFYPEKWNDRAIIPAMSVASNKFKYSVNKQIWDDLGSVDDQDAQRSYVIPTYEVHSALSFQKTRKDVVLSDGEEILIGISGDINHPGPEANATMGYQILSWIYYTLAQL